MENIDETTQYYLNAFERLEKEGKHTWNWAACFFNVAWLGYRKMYLEAAIIFIINTALGFALCDKVVENFVRGDIQPTVIALIAFNIFTYAFFGYFGNSLYYRKVKYMVKKGFHEIPENRPTSLFCAFTVFAMPFFYLSDYMAIRNREPINTDISEGNIIKYLDVSGSRKKHIYDKIATILGILAILVQIGIGVYGKYYTKKVDIHKKMEMIKKNVETK